MEWKGLTSNSCTAHTHKLNRKGLVSNSCETSFFSHSSAKDRSRTSDAFLFHVCSDVSLSVLLVAELGPWSSVALLVVYVLRKKCLAAKGVFIMINF